MTLASHTLSLADLSATEAFADRLAPLVRPGDVLLLEGDVGAGKTAFCRALIGALRQRAGLPPEDVPSPTFTLVQTYDVGAFEVWHADLYRLTGPDGALELGLEEAFADALCLIEWPDRLGHDAPSDALRIQMTTPAAGTDGDMRSFTLTGPTTALARLAPAFAKDSA